MLVEAADTCALFNFLLNCRTCIANTGPQAGIPPTILAPIAFKGATLKAHKVGYIVTNYGTLGQCNYISGMTDAFVNQRLDEYTT